MSSQIKPKVICKNLEDIIKESMFSTKRNSVQNAQKRQQCQRILKSEPRERRGTERCNTSVSRSNKLYESGKRLNTSISKHSLESKQKIKILESRISSNTSATKIIQQKKSRNAVMPTSAVEFYSSSNKNTKTTTSGSIPTTTHFKSLYFNQVDAILTQLQDFIRETREKICLEMDFMNEENVADMLANQLTELSNVFRSELEGLIDRSLYVETGSEVLRPKNRVNEIISQNQTLKQSLKPYSSSKHPKSPFQQQLIKIQQFMQRQATSPSTINSQPQQSLPTQTDAQILSMLVYKNKILNTKRKMQSTDSYGQDLMSPWVKSGRSSKEAEGEYSFRNKAGSKEKDYGGTLREVDMRKKKNAVEKSSNKENREKSIYQMVLEENRRTKGDWRR